MMGFKGRGHRVQPAATTGVSEQWWDLKARESRASGAGRAVLANNDGI